MKHPEIYEKLDQCLFELGRCYKEISKINNGEEGFTIALTLLDNIGSTLMQVIERLYSEENRNH